MKNKETGEFELVVGNGVLLSSRQAAEAIDKLRLGIDQASRAMRESFFRRRRSSP